METYPKHQIPHSLDYLHKMAENPVKTLTIDNFHGSMTQYIDGDVNSGLSSVFVSSGATPFVKPGKLTWGGSYTQIDSAGSVITDLIMAGKVRTESGILYVYAIGHTGRVYKIQVNDPTSYNPNYDNPVLLATLTAQTPTFTRGGFIDFFGSTERIYIGHDKGLTRIDFDGTGEAFVGALGSWTQTVPRPLKQFLGKLYIGNGENLAEVDSTATVTSYSRLSPAFPNGSQVRDIDVSPDGNYLQTIVTRLALGDLTSGAQETSSTANSESYIFKWNGTDVGYTSFTTFPSFSLCANTMFQNYQYTFGYDQNGLAVFNPNDKLLSLQEVTAPNPNAISSNGNMLTFMTTLPYAGFLEAEMFYFGQFDHEVGTGFWDLFFQTATGTETDVIRVPCQIPVSNLGIGASSNGYSEKVFSAPKIYYSTLETSSAPTTKYKFYKWSPSTSPFYTQTPLEEAVYQTQNQKFSKKIKVGEVRVYGSSWVANNSFLVDLIGSSGDPISGGSKTFIAGTNLTIGDDFAWYIPDISPTYTLALRITNLGTVNHTIDKVEIDYSIGGK